MRVGPDPTRPLKTKGALWRPSTGSLQGILRRPNLDREVDHVLGIDRHGLEEPSGCRTTLGVR